MSMEVEEETGGLLDEAGAPASAEHPDLKRLLSYWHTQRGDRSFPRRADIDPIDLHFMLERIALVEIHGEAPRRYRVRVVGTWWSRTNGFDPTGMWLEDWPNP